jgi:hypothetical protein
MRLILLRVSPAEFASHLGKARRAHDAPQTSDLGQYGCHEVGRWYADMSPTLGSSAKFTMDLRNKRAE